MSRFWGFALGLFVLSASSAWADVEVGQGVGPFPPTRACETVTIFGLKIHPLPAKVEKNHAAFLGKWSNGAWDGELCHDLIVTEIRSNGTAKVILARGDHEGWRINHAALSYDAHFIEGDRLQVDVGETRFIYWIEGKVMKGVWRSPGRPVAITLQKLR